MDTARLSVTAWERWREEEQNGRLRAYFEPEKKTGKKHKKKNTMNTKRTQEKKKKFSFFPF